MTNNIRNKYNELIKKHKQLKSEEEKLKDEHADLLEEYNLCNKAYSDSCDIYTKVDNRLNERERKYIAKKHSKHINKVMLITLVLALGCASIYSALGFVADKFLLYWGSCILAPIAGLIDIKFFWDKLRKKYEEDFKNLDSTKSTKDTLDKLYVQKLRNNKELNEINEKVVSHSKLTTAVSNEKKSIEDEIKNLKFKFFEDTFGSDVVLSDENKLILK